LLPGRSLESQLLVLLVLQVLQEHCLAAE
jgi:hypothetical protein